VSRRSGRVADWKGGRQQQCCNSSNKDLQPHAAGASSSGAGMIRCGDARHSLTGVQQCLERCHWRRGTARALSCAAAVQHMCMLSTACHALVWIKPLLDLE
jgi:hypothetical protein